ncbi:MAG TPA: sulfatase-like hydrolase/transferase, partial [Candidatus Bathyarchaeia archaeon]|nr:sulfatase-like hydrolase/transferase [Candidatus Bathyarchaeia archaeon]
HQAGLYWLALLGLVAAVWPTWRPARSRINGLLFGVLALAGIYLVAEPFLPGLQNNWSAYRWSLLALLPLLSVAAADLRRYWPEDSDQDPNDSLSYSNAVWVALAVALLYAASVQVRGYADDRSLKLGLAQVELTVWSMVSHVLLALFALSLLNLVRLATRRMRRRSGWRLALYGTLTALSLGTAVDRFLGSALSFEGWPAYLYAALFAVSVALFLGSLVLPFLSEPNAFAAGQDSPFRFRLIPLIVAVSFSLLAIALPTLIGGGDWDGVIQSTFTIFFWITLTVCVYLLRPRRSNYSLAAILGVLLLAGIGYKALQMTEIFWGRPLGSTDDEVARAMENYAAQDASFALAHHILGNARQAPCGDLCRILREYTNIRDAEAKTDLRLVDPLVPNTASRPNIFIFVIDSMRPDYLGAYNLQADFTPNIDTFARDNIVLRNVYTQYAGTSLSEPAIWAGAALLHAHYMQPFSKVNSLEKLARADGYQMVVSYDEVLSQILSPSDDLVKLDTDKKLWNQLELCSTVRQAKTLLDNRLGQDRPLLFYTQPKNVHQFARNDMPGMTTENWRVRHGFDNRIAYEMHQVDTCLGDFFRYLKAHGLYDGSIIIVTSDHGDATGEFGRYSHSLSIYPEVMRVPLIVHLPAEMRRRFIYDDHRISALTDITPSLYYLLGHRPVRMNPIFGHPLFVETREELQTYRRSELFLASDERAAYGLLAENGRFLYATYDFPAQGFLFDLSHDPNAQHNLLTPNLEQEYDERIIEQLHAVADFYGYKPGVGSLLAAAH